MFYSLMYLSTLLGATKAHIQCRPVVVRSEGPLHTSFGAIGASFVTSDERDFTIQVDRFRESNGSTDFTGQFQFRVNTVSSHDGRTSLDIPAFAFITNVIIDNGGRVIIANKTRVGFYIYVRTGNSSTVCTTEEETSSNNRFDG